MEPSPLMTVITVCRNDLPGVRRTSASLAGQTLDRVQHVVVDGASTDGTAEWVRGHPAVPDAVLLSEPDRGIYQAMNKGVGLARGELLYFLNSGDVLAGPDVLARVAASYRRERWRWAYGRSERVDGQERVTRRDGGADFSWWQQAYWHYDIPQQAVFMRTELVGELGGFDEDLSIAGDYRMVLSAGRRYRPHRLPWVVTRVLAGGVSSRRARTALTEAHRVRSELLQLGRPARALDRAWTDLMIVKANGMRALRFGKAF